jgi:hypothetical protein
MAPRYNNNVKNTRLAAVVSAIGGTGKLVIGTASLAGGASGVLASVDLANPAFTVDNGVMTLGGLPLTAIAANAGTAALAELRAGNGVVVADQLTVGTSNTDIIINTVNVSQGQTIQIIGGSITHG